MSLIVVLIYINSILNLRIKFCKIKRKTNCEGINLGKNYIQVRKLGERTGLDTLVALVDNDGC